MSMSTPTAPGAAAPAALRAAKLGAVVVKALRARGFEAEYAGGAGDAIEKILALIPEDHVVAWGGSETVVTLDLPRRLAGRGARVIDRDTAKSPGERAEIMRRALLCDTFLMSANALSEDGQLVNVDGNGNRLAALLYGPRQVIVVAGINKVVKTAADAVTRARTVAAPLNVQRFPGAKTPCAETGSCADCRSPESICAHIVTTRVCRPAGRIKVILVGEPLGY